MMYRGRSATSANSWDAATSVDVPAAPPRDTVPEKPTSSWQISWPLVAGLVLFVVLLSAASQLLLADPDSRWHVAVGRGILESGSVPRTDSYSHTFVGQPWIAKEWLSQVVMALADRAGGWGGVAALCAAAIAIAFALLLRLLLHDIRPAPAMLFT